MPRSSFSRECGVANPELSEYHIYQPFPSPESEHSQEGKPTAITGRISLIAEDYTDISRTRSVLWEALDHSQLDLEDYPVCSADGGQVNFYFPDHSALEKMYTSISLVLGWLEKHPECACKVHMYCADTAEPTIRNGYIDPALQLRHNLYLMQPNFLSAVRTAQWHAQNAPQSQHRQYAEVYRSALDKQQLENPTEIRAKHGMMFYAQHSSTLLPHHDAGFMERVQHIQELPVEDVNKQFPTQQPMLVKIDMNNGSLRAANGQALQFLTGSLVSNLFQELQLDEVVTGQIHEEAYFGYMAWETLKHFLFHPHNLSQLTGVLKETDFKMIAYPAAPPRLFSPKPGERPYAVAHHIQEPLEKHLETLAKERPEGLAVQYPLR